MNSVTLESSLRSSIELYSRMIALLRSLEEDLGTAPQETLQQMNALLTEMQTQASDTDQLIMSQLTSDDLVKGTTQKLVSERAKMINDVLLLNRNVMIKAMGVKSLLAHEIGTLRSGKSALNGYRPPQHNQGRIVNRAL